MQKITIGVVGAGLIAREHAITLARHPQAAKLVFFDVDAARAKALAGEFHGGTAPTEEALIAAADLVWICTPPSTHLATVERAALAAKPIFCEKPLALTEADLAGIERAVAAADIPFFMGQSGRWSDPFRKMREKLEQGAIGEPVQVWSTRLGYLDPAKSPAWRLDDRASGGVLIELGCHEIDYIRWVGGDWLTAKATGSSRIVAPGKFLDTVTAVGTLSSGANANLYLSWAEPRYLWQRGIQGTEGSLFIDDMRFTKVELWRPGKSEPEIIEAANWKHPETGENMAFHDQANAVMVAMQESTPYEVTLADGAAAVRAALAIRQSMDSPK